MKKRLLIFLTIVLIISLIGCKYETAGEAWVKKINMPQQRQMASSADIRQTTMKQSVIADTRPVFRCFYTYHSVMNHYLSFDANCEGNHVDGVIGYVYHIQKVNTRPLYQCYRQTRHDHRTYTDHFTSFDPKCEGQHFDRIMGYIPLTNTQDTTVRYRCWNQDNIGRGIFDHLVSADSNCEGYTHKEETYYFIDKVLYRDQCTGDIKDSLQNNQQRSYIIKGSDYEVLAIILGNQVKFKVNGEITEVLQGGQSDTLSSGAKIEAEQIWPGEAVSFCLTGATQPAQNLILVNDGAPANDVIIAVDASLFLGNSVTDTKLDSEVFVRTLFDYSLIARIFLSDVNILVNPAKISEEIAQNLTNHMLQNPRVSNASYSILSQATVRDLVEYSQP